jgi:hypothetical protein
MRVTEAYRPRRVLSRGVRATDGWRLKTYMIVYGDSTPDWNRFEDGIAAARSLSLWLPEPPARPGRFGLGFVIGHQGRSSDYLVLKWWDNENELPGRVLIHDRIPHAPWRPARIGEDVCVWDIAVIWHERNVFIRTVLARTGEPDAEAYLADCFVGPA